MIRVSTTQLDSFRLVCETDWKPENELIAQIKREPFTPTWQMQGGTAFHSAVEGASADDGFIADGKSYRTWGGFTFEDMTVGGARALIGPGQWEVKATKVYDVGRLVNLVAQVDHIHGLVIQDNKTKWASSKPWDVESYADSLQWRAYLDILGASVFRYNLFEFKDPDGGGYCELRNVSSIRFWPYHGMREDVLVWLRRFVEWCEHKGLISYLEQRQKAAEVAA